MTSRYSLADVAALIGEPTRAAMLLALFDGEALPASELARIADLSAPATSLHLAKLTAGGLVAVRKEGRHRYYRLASGEVAHALEALGLVATAPPKARALTPEQAALRAARTCYDHLAGVTAVVLAEAFERKRLLTVVYDATYEVTPRGIRWFAEHLAIDVAELARSRRLLARRCLDWTERRPHLAGALGAAVLERFVERRWATRAKGSRAVRLRAGCVERLELSS
ncbi:winged helix-turn-helix domain-containing protein [soil metagenome]